MTALPQTSEQFRLEIDQQMQDWNKNVAILIDIDSRDKDGTNSTLQQAIAGGRSSTRDLEKLLVSL